MALLAVTAALLIRLALDPLLKNNLQLLTFYGAVTVAAWFGGWRPGLVAAVVGYGAVAYFFLPPRYHLGWTPEFLAGLIGYASCSGLIIYCLERMHRSHDELRRAYLHQDAIESHLVWEKELLDTTLASIADAVLVTDAHGIVRSLNPEAERLTGWKQSEAVGLPVREVFQLLNEQTGEPVEGVATEVLRSGQPTAPKNENILMARGGARTPIDDRGTPIRDPDGALIGALVVFRDVTGQRQAEQARAHLAAIVEYSGDAVVSKDLNGVIRSWNASAERLFGYRPEEIIGKPVTILIPQDRLNEEEQILSRLRNGLPAERIETQRLTKDGRRIAVSVSVSPIKDREGRVVGASKLVHDISDRKMWERQLAQQARALDLQREELERIVAERTAELHRSLHSLEELLYTIAHDLRAPNRAMEGYSHLLETEYASRLDETARGYLQRIRAAALRNDALIQDLLKFGRLAHADVPMTPVDPRTVAEATIRSVQDEVEKRQATIEMAPTGWPKVWANAMLLEQVFSNLVSNALRYVPPGRAPRIQISATADPDMARIDVRDNGAGIPAEKQAKVFEPFTRLNNAEGSEGTGMGLAIVRKAVERMRGRISVESVLGQGSLFRVQLPLAQQKG